MADKQELAATIAKSCGFPREVVREAIADIELKADIYSSSSPFVRTRYSMVDARFRHNIRLG